MTAPTAHQTRLHTVLTPMRRQRVGKNTKQKHTAKRDHFEAHEHSEPIPGTSSRLTASCNAGGHPQRNAQQRGKTALDRNTSQVQRKLRLRTCPRKPRPPSKKPAKAITIISALALLAKSFAMRVALPYIWSCRLTQDSIQHGRQNRDTDAPTRMQKHWKQGSV